MKIFEIIASESNLVSHPAVQPYRWDLWCAAFQVETLDDLFDVTPAAQAIPVIDAAIERFNTHSEELRPLVSAEDPFNLRTNRKTIEGIRNFLAAHGGTISGVFDDPTNP
jgi:hypothetical protein